MSDESGRHSFLPLIENYIAQGVSGIVDVPGAPQVQLMIDGSSRSLGLRTPFDGDELDVVSFENITSEIVHDEGVAWQQLLVRLDDNLEDVYALLVGIIDRVQLSGEPFGNAVRDALSSLLGILALRRGLSRVQL